MFSDLIRFGLLITFCCFEQSWANGTEIKELECQDSGLCFPKDYDKKVPPNSTVDLVFMKPLRTRLREINVFKSTLTLEVYYMGMEWADSRLEIKNKSNFSSDLYLAMPQKFEDLEIWIPEPELVNLKSLTRKGQRKSLSGN